MNQEIRFGQKWYNEKEELSCIVLGETDFGFILQYEDGVVAEWHEKKVVSDEKYLWMEYVGAKRTVEVTRPNINNTCDPDDHEFPSECYDPTTDSFACDSCGVEIDALIWYTNQRDDILQNNCITCISCGCELHSRKNVIDTMKYYCSECNEQDYG